MAIRQMVLIGYLVLTKQPDGSWGDDWDGKIHTDRTVAEQELDKAAAFLGEDGVKLGQLFDVP